MSNLGIHDSTTCARNNGQPCEMCCFAQGVQEERERMEWSLEAEMNNFSARYGEEALCEKIDVFMTARGLY